MKLILTILLTKILRILLKIIGRGSSMPGKIALKIYPDVLNKIKMPQYVIAVTGSNGKTSTVEMIHEVLKKAGISIAYNSEGSNQIDGVATLILSNCNILGKFKKDVLLLESDERYAQYTFKYFVPTHYVITNLYRDQMTRNGNPDYVLGEIKKSIKKETTLILNDDDPEIASLANNNKCIYFGIDKNQYSIKKNDFIYDDGYYCPKCKARLIYKYRQFGHVGNYCCSKCDFERVKPHYYVSNIDLNENKIVINKKDEIQLGFSSIYNVYNILAAYSICASINVDTNIICSALSNYVIKNGRVKTFELGDSKGTLLISKHENSVSYNKNISYVLNQKKNITIVLMVDAISRKYFTSETSWLWDINFELLNANNIKKIVVTGRYSSDLATRLQYAGIDLKSVYINPNINETIQYLKEKNKNYIYVLTCFSDENKFTKGVKII